MDGLLEGEIKECLHSTHKVYLSCGARRTAVLGGLRTKGVNPAPLGSRRGEQTGVAAAAHPRMGGHLLLMRVLELKGNIQWSFVVESSVV